MDYTYLTSAPIYIKVPAKSRLQEFVLYEITNNIQNELKNIEQLPYIYLTLNHNKTLVLFPFSHEIKSSQLDNVDFDFINENYKLYSYGHSYRSRSSNVKFEIHDTNRDLLDPTDFIIDDDPHFDISKIKQGLKNHINSTEFTDMLNDPLATRQFFQSLANDAYKQIYTQSDIDTIIDLLKNNIPNAKDEYQTAYQDVIASASLRSKAQPFGQYLKLYQTDKNKHKNNNIAQQMLSMLDKNFEPNPKLELALAADLIAQIYPPHLINQDGKDKDNVVIFNPIEGVWTHNNDIFYALLTAIRPYSKETECATMIATFAAQARNKDNFINPYNRSQHLLFKNCALDIKDMKVYSLDDNFVKDLNFTERCQLNLNYDPEVTEPPEFPGKRSHDNGPWDPYNFFMAYADNDPEKLNFLMFGLSLGLFGGHNFGVHFSMKGESRWGKTTLNEIFKALYPNKVVDELYSKLNGQFGLTNFNAQTSVVWFRECNVEADPLNNAYGVPVYDGFADNNMSIQIKQTKDLQIQNPPQVFVDGTSYVKADDMDTGPAGRTFVFKFPMEGSSNHDINELIKQAYGSPIKDLLQNETVLQFLVNLMIQSYKTCLNFKAGEENRLWSLKLNLGGKSGDNKLLPSFAQEWRKEMTQAQGDIQDWFEYEFLPYLSTDPKNPTKMHNALAYGFYVNSYKNKYSRQDPLNRSILTLNSFGNQLMKLLKQANFEQTAVIDQRGRKTRRSYKYLEKTNFDITRYTADDNLIPKEFTKENIDSDHKENSFPLATRTSGWYNLTKIKS